MYAWFGFQVLFLRLNLAGISDGVCNGDPQTQESSEKDLGKESINLGKGPVWPCRGRNRGSGAGGLQVLISHPPASISTQVSISKTGSLHKPATQHEAQKPEEQKPDSAVSRLERREHLKKANTLPTSVTGRAQVCLAYAFCSSRSSARQSSIANAEPVTAPLGETTQRHLFPLREVVEPLIFSMV